MWISRSRTLTRLRLARLPFATLPSVLSTQYISDILLYPIAKNNLQLQHSPPNLATLSFCLFVLLYLRSFDTPPTISCILTVLPTRLHLSSLTPHSSRFTSHFDFLLYLFNIPFYARSCSSDANRAIPPSFLFAYVLRERTRLISSDYSYATVSAHAAAILPAPTSALKS